MPRGPRNLRIASDGVGLTQFGGVALIEQFFQRIGLQGALSDHIRFIQRNHRYSISESLKALLYPLVLVAVTLLPFAIRMSGFLYLGAAVALGAVFVGYAVALLKRYSDQLAQRTFRYSIFYLAALFSALLFDRYWR